MRILSLNCWSGRVPGLVEYLQSVEADVYCLQEILSSPPDTPDELMYEGQGSTSEPQRSKLFQEICRALPFHQGVHLPSSRGFLHDTAKTQYAAQYGIATFVRHTLPVIRSAQVFAFGEFREEWGNLPHPRPAHIFKVVRNDGTSLTLAQMHGLWQPNGKIDTPERNEQSQNFRSEIRKMRWRDEGVVVCGDFNVLPGSELITSFKKDGYRELVTEGGFDDTRTSYYKKQGRFADYMLIKAVVPNKFEVVTTPEVSDHRPLLLDIQ